MDGIEGEDGYPIPGPQGPSRAAGTSGATVLITEPQHRVGCNVDVFFNPATGAISSSKSARPWRYECKYCIIQVQVNADTGSNYDYLTENRFGTGGAACHDFHASW